MSVERDRILKMVETGTVSAAEASDLLAAMNQEAPSAAGASPAPHASENRPWEAPFIAGIVLSGFGLFGLLRSRRSNVLARISGWVMLLLGAGAALVGLWSRDVPWLHISVREQGGNDIRFSLPLLLPVARAAIALARGFVDDATGQQLDSAAAFISSLQRGEQVDPLSVEIEDGDGGQVHVSVY